MPGSLRSAAAFLLGATLAGSAMAEVGPHALLDVSEELIRIYNAEDAPALHRLLAPPLQAKYPVETLRTTLTHCRVLTHDLFRFSIPSWGTRRFGFFAAYTETSVFEMILEIDENEKIIHWVLTDNVTSGDQQCSIDDLR
jgi:hypothetical protein